jgi:HAE1 family hydrophobic/amphiphilic exporter-1
MLPLVDIAKDVSARMMSEPSLTDVKANLNLNNPELQVNIDRQLASDLGVRVSDVAGAVRLLMSGEDQISTFKEGSEQYPVTMRLMSSQRDDPAALSRLLIPSAKQGLIRLDSIAKLERGLGPSRIDRYNRQFAVGIYGNVSPGHSLGAAAATTQNIIRNVGLPPGFSMTFSGQVKILEETTTNMLLAFGLASIFMYMVLAAQFESLAHPFVILLTLPLSIPFALLSLIGTGRTLNLFSALGVLLLDLWMPAENRPKLHRTPSKRASNMRWPSSRPRPSRAARRVRTGSASRTCCSSARAAPFRAPNRSRPRRTIRA